MKRILLPGLLLLGLLSGLAPTAAEARGDGTLSVRLVRASRHTAGTDPALQDVANALGASFAFQGYQRVAQAAQPLPADDRPLRLGPYTVRCRGGRQSLEIRVEQGRQRLLNTTARLTGARPLILGGFPAGNGDIFVLVFVAR